MTSRLSALPASRCFVITVRALAPSISASVPAIPTTRISIVTITSMSVKPRSLRRRVRPAISKG